MTNITYDPISGWSSAIPESSHASTAVFAFADPSFRDHQEPFAELARRLPFAQIIGCSSAGEISGERLREGSMAVAIAEFDATTVRSASAAVSQLEHSRSAGREVGRQLADADLRAVFVLSDGLGVNGSELVRGLVETVGEDTVVTGGLAGDGSRFENTWVIGGGQLASGMVAALGFYGDKFVVGSGSMGGWTKFGPERYVTRSRGSVLFELDGQPALQLYKRYLGDLADELPASALLYPLAVHDPNEPERTIVRTILAVSEEDQSLTFAGDVPQGHIAQLMHAHFDRLITGAEVAAENALAPAMPLGELGDVLSIAISCVGRRLILGSRAVEEVEATLHVLPPGASQLGFYSYGEISPNHDGTCDLHNQTMTVTNYAETA